MAAVSPRIRSTSVEAQEFAEMSQRYEVSSVPRIVINDRYVFVGGLPEADFVDAVLAVVDQVKQDSEPG